jgi:hypothetical protein
MPVYVHAVWKLQIPPRVQIFLWLLANNRLLSRDNFAKCREVMDQSCFFCKEKETIIHLFFDCCVAKRVWTIVFEVLHLNEGCDFELIVSCWIANKKQANFNTISSSMLWSFGKLWNKMCFLG